MKNQSSSHFPSTPRAMRNFIEAWKGEGRWKVKEKCEEMVEGWRKRWRGLGFWGAPNPQNLGF